MARRLGKLALWFLAILALLVLAFVGVVSLGIRIDLSEFRPVLTAAASTALGREVRIDGAIVLVPTFSPTVEIEDLYVGNPEGWPTATFATMEHARVQVATLPLLRRRATVRELLAEGVTLSLENTADGRVNWAFGGKAPAEEEPPPEEPKPKETTTEALHDLLVDAIEITTIQFHDVKIQFANVDAGESVTLELSELRGSAATDGPVKLVLNGALEGEPYELKVLGGPPVDLLFGRQPWPLEATVEIAGAELALTGTIDDDPPDSADSDPSAPQEASPVGLPGGRRFGELELSLRGEKLDSFESLLAVELPHWGPYSVEAKVRAFQGGRYEADVAIKVGGSDLSGTLSLESDAKPPRAETRLSTRRLQLDDFGLKGWSPFGSEESSAPSDAGASGDATDVVAVARQARGMLTPEVMRSLDYRLEVDVGRVIAGRDKLGKGRLVATLEKGRFRLHPLHVEFPGGSLEVTASLKPSRNQLDTELSIDIDRFDYGVLARRVAPESDMRGLLGVELALRSQTDEPAELMKNASGKIDFAVFPEEFEAGVIDLWAVNLVASVLPQLDSSDASKVNCVIGLFDVEDGLLQQKALLIDTTRMRVTGSAEANFRDRTVHAELAPEAKTPQFFALATPIVVDGTFDDFSAGVKPEDLIGTVIRFVTSVVHVPLRWLLQPQKDRDELADCLDVLEIARGR